MKKIETVFKRRSFCFLTLLIVFITTTAYGVTINVPADHLTIQAAINAANPDDTILVDDGTYTENVIVDRQLVIRSVNGYNSTTVVGRPAYKDHVFEITAAGVTIDGFTIYDDTTSPSDMQAGIFVASGADQCTITNNRCGYDTTHCNGNGIIIYQSNNNTLLDNICNSNYREGIDLNSSHLNIISGNSCNSNYWGYGIELGNSNNNTFFNNICTSNYRDGVILFFSNNNTFSENNCSGNSRGIAIADSSTGNTLLENNCSGNQEGIQLRYSADNNTLLNNICNSNTNRGIYFYQNCANNIVSGNTCSENVDGLGIFNSSNNTFYFNNFTNNTNDSVNSGGTNSWISPSKINYIYEGLLYSSYLGNYFSDNIFTDSDGNGVTDAPYVLGGSEPDDEYSMAGNSDEYTIVILPSLKGDVDGDGDLDGTDLEVIAQNFGQTP